MYFNSYCIESDVIAGYTLPIIIYFGLHNIWQPLHTPNQTKLLLSLCNNQSVLMHLIYYLLLIYYLIFF